MLYREEPAEERAIVSEGLSQIFCRDVVAALELPLELCSFVGKHLRQPLDNLGHKAVCLLYNPARLVYESDLNSVPPSLKIIRLFGGEQRR
jgi:hypothetical protein